MQAGSGRRVAFDLACVALVLGYSLVGMRNFSLRIAQAHEDDTPAFYAYAFKDPALFAGDFPIGIPVAEAVPLKVATSAMVWIPSVLWRYLDVDPYRTMWLLTLVQGLSIGLSIYVLTITMVRSRTVAALAVIFGYVATPWCWDPANYGGGASWTFLPYPAHLAIAPTLLAFACVVRGRNVAALALLGTAALIHPTLTLFACLILGLYWLFEAVESRSATSLRWLMGLAGVGLIAVLPGLWVQLTLPGGPLPRAELMAGFRQNQHLWPWGYEGRWNFSVPTTLAWLVLGALAWRWRAGFSRNVGRLWVSALAAVVVLSLSHIAGAVFEIPTLLNLSGLRSWMWLALLSLPLVAYYWSAHLQSGNVVSAVAVLLCVLLPLVAGEYPLFWPLVLCLLLTDLSEGRLAGAAFTVRRWQGRALLSLALGVMIGWGMALVFIPYFPPELAGSRLLAGWYRLSWGYGRLPGQSTRVMVLGIAVVGGLAASAFRQFVERLRVRTPAMGRAGMGMLACRLLVVVSAAYVGWTDWRAAEAAGNPQSSDAMTVQLQLWTRDHTPPSSLFVVPIDGWRTLSQRRMISPFTRESYAYVAPRGAKERRDRMLAFYGISKADAAAKRGGRMLLEERARFRRFREPDFIRFAAEFGATHLVLPVCYPVTDQVTFDLPLVYRNPCYAVYRLDGGPGANKQ
jgi:hypothetical protein